MTSTELVTVTVGGMPLTGWKSFSATGSARSPERSFEVVAAAGGPVDLFSAAVGLQPGMPVTIASNGSLIVTGYINKKKISIKPESHEVHISGKSKGQDAVKCSVDHDSYEWKKKNALQIAQSIDKTGIGYFTDENLKVLDKVRANVGDSPHKFLDKLLRRERMFMTGQADGRIKICRHCKERHAGGIIEGDNLITGDAEFSDEDRMEKVKVKGHQPSGTGEKSFRYEEEATDEGGRKGRTKIILPRTTMSKDEAKQLAEHSVDNRFGDSVKFSCTLQGFRDMAGRLWEAGLLVWCEAPSLDLMQDLAIDQWTFEQDEKQSMTQLSLVHPAALGKSGGRAGKSKRGGGSSSWGKR